MTIVPKVSGYITDILVGDNQAVEADTPLAKLDTRQYQASLDQAKTTLDTRAADIQRAEADLRQQHANEEQAEVARVSRRTQKAM